MYDFPRVFSDWKIEKKIGNGTIGTVFSAYKIEGGVKKQGVVKHITFPRGFSEIKKMKSHGLEDAEIREKLRRRVDAFVKEMSLIKSLPNIVSVEECKAIESEKEIFWDIYILMEAFTPLNKAICAKKFTEEDVAKLGVDICTALEVGERNGIMHRAIKPDNIFVDSTGNFLLGDFALVQNYDFMCDDVIYHEAPSYSAPEIANGKIFNSRADIYSLGMVMYRLLNENMFPFFTENSLGNANERKEALERRFGGEALPPPSKASEKMAKIILSACDFEPVARFGEAEEMKRAIVELYKDYFSSIAICDGTDVKIEDKTATEKAEIKTVGTGVNRHLKPIKNKTIETPAENNRETAENNKETAENDKGVAFEQNSLDVAPVGVALKKTIKFGENEKSQLFAETQTATASQPATASQTATVTSTTATQTATASQLFTETQPATASQTATVTSTTATHATASSQAATAGLGEDVSQRGEKGNDTNPSNENGSADDSNEKALNMIPVIAIGALILACVMLLTLFFAFSGDDEEKSDDASSNGGISENAESSFGSNDSYVSVDEENSSFEINSSEGFNSSDAGNESAESSDESLNDFSQESSADESSSSGEESEDVLGEKIYLETYEASSALDVLLVPEKISLESTIDMIVGETKKLSWEVTYNTSLSYSLVIDSFDKEGWQIDVECKKNQEEWNGATYSDGIVAISFDNAESCEITLHIKAIKEEKTLEATYILNVSLPEIDIEWGNTDNTVVKAESGVLEALGEGVAKITATIKDTNIFAYCDVTVVTGNDTSDDDFSSDDDLPTDEESQEASAENSVADSDEL